jgi:hypothetical protein
LGYFKADKYNELKKATIRWGNYSGSSMKMSEQTKLPRMQAFLPPSFQAFWLIENEL